MAKAFSELLSKPLVVAELWKIHQKSTKTDSVINTNWSAPSTNVSDSIGSSTFLPLLAISFGRNRLGALDNGKREWLHPLGPSFTPFSAAKAVPPLLRPWF